MKLGVLFSGGKDSCYSAYLEKKAGHELACLISIFSENKESFMFHTPSIEKVKKQSEVMQIPLLIEKTKGKKEEELKDLEKAIKKAKEKYKIEGIVTGAIRSVYQAERIQKICDKLNLKCINPLWQKEEIGYLEELIKNKFEIVIVGIGAEGFDESWLGKKINKDTLNELKDIKEKFGINVSFEGGEAETFVLWCPLFKKRLKIIKCKKIMDGRYSGRLDIQEIEVE
ncbi:MAG: diphthine--ammonia ligase [archaeon]|nr:diphthine--ammonia ligase [archaeon]